MPLIASNQSMQLGEDDHTKKVPRGERMMIASGIRDELPLCRWSSLWCLISPINSDLVRERENWIDMFACGFACLMLLAGMARCECAAAADRFNWRRRRHRRHKFRLIDTRGDKRLLRRRRCLWIHSLSKSRCAQYTLRYMGLGMRYCCFPNLIARRPPWPLSPASLPRLFFHISPARRLEMPARRQPRSAPELQKWMREFFRRTVWPFPFSNDDGCFLSGRGTFRQWMRKWTSLKRWQVALWSVCLVSRADFQLDMGSISRKIGTAA